MDALNTGRRIKCLTCVDDFTKECLTIITAFGISGVQVTVFEAFVRELAQRVLQHGDALMSIAQQLEQKGRAEGLQIGEQRGIEKGEREVTLKIACTMLQNGIDRNTVMKTTGLTEDDLAQIHH